MSQQKGVFSDGINYIKETALATLASSDPKKTNKYQQFSEDAMRSALEGFKRHQNPNDAKQAELIEKWKYKIESGQLLDEHMCSMMINDLGTLIGGEGGKKYKEDANKLVSDLNGEIKKVGIKDEEIWKYQLLQVFAIMTPLGAFSIAGQVFNWLDPLLDIFGPILGEGGIAQGIADASTSKQLGPFGKFAELIRFDDAVKTVLTKTPILSDVIEVASAITTSENVQLLGAEVSPALTGSELLIIGIAGAAVILNAGDELDHRKNKKNLDTKIVSALKKLDSIIPKPAATKALSAPQVPVSESLEQKSASLEELQKSLPKPAPAPSPTQTKGEPLIEYTKGPDNIINSSRGKGISVHS